MLKSDEECMKDNYILAARDLASLALTRDSIGLDKEMATAENILSRLRGAMQAYRSED